MVEKKIRSRSGSMKKVFKVFETEGQVKKHISQMSPKEIEYLNEKLDELANSFIKKSHHLQTKEDMQDVSILVFKHILKNKARRNIIEYNETTKYGLKSRRILVRDSKPFRTKFMQAHEYASEGYANLCFVIDIDRAVIITAYYNYDKDEHFTVDMSRYEENLCIC